MSAKQKITKYSAPNKQLDKKRLLLFSGFTLLVFTSVFLFIKYDPLAAKSQCNRSGSSVLYDEASKALDTGSIADMKAITEKIQKEKNYQKDANCLYPLVAYYVFMQDADNATVYYVKLTEVYDEKDKFAAVYGKQGIKNLNDVKSSVDALQKKRENSNGNTKFFN
jgi:hypothetical protein